MASDAEHSAAPWRECVIFPAAELGGGTQQRILSRTRKITPTSQISLTHRTYHPTYRTYCPSLIAQRPGLPLGFRGGIAVFLLDGGAAGLAGRRA